MVPFLGAPLDEVIEQGDLAVDVSGWQVRYHLFRNGLPAASALVRDHSDGKP